MRRRRRWMVGEALDEHRGEHDDTVFGALGDVVVKQKLVGMAWSGDNRCGRSADAHLRGPSVKQKVRQESRSHSKEMSWSPLFPYGRCQRIRTSRRQLRTSDHC